MDEQYQSLFPKKDWLFFLTQHPMPLHFASEKKRKEFIISLIREIEALIDNGKIGQTIDRISLGFYIAKDYFLRNLKKSGMLRHSSYLKKRNPLKGIVEYLLKHDVFFKWNPNEKRYWQSLAFFDEFYLEMNRVINFIDVELKTFKTQRFNNQGYSVSRFKSLLVRNEMAFLTNIVGDQSSKDLLRNEFYSKEEISTAISMLVSRYAEKFEIEVIDLSLVDTEYTASPACTRLISEACRMRQFLELEIEIETFGFICYKEGKHSYIEHPDEDFEKSLVISNVFYNLQMIANLYYAEWQNKHVVSMVELADLIYSKMPGTLKLVREPYTRYTLEIPIPLIQSFLEDQQQFFREEIVSMIDIAKELLVPFEKLETYELRKGLTLEDFIRLMRFFRIQSFIMSHKLRGEIGKVPDQWIFQSVVAKIDYEQLVDYLTELISRKKAEIFLDMVTWKTNDVNKFLDLQYRPILQFNNSYYIPLNVLGTSNLPRNIFASESRNDNNIKGLQISNHTGLPDILTRIFAAKGFLTEKEIPVRFKGTGQVEGDIDFLAFKDGVLMIAECKDAIHPTDTFELRTTWNHVQKAASQLKYLMEALNDVSYRKILLTPLGVSIEEIKVIRPVIVMSNNKFWGYTIDGFPIRDIRIFVGYFLDGCRNIRLEEGMAKFRLWKNKEFDVTDLLHFLDQDGPHTPNFQACEAVKYKFGNNLYRKTYTVNITEVYRIMKEKYHFEYEDVPDTEANNVENVIFDEKTPM